MFAFLKGPVVQTSPAIIILEVNGVGYELHITLHTYEKIQGKTEVKLYTHLQIREDAWTLFGFADEQERSTFRLLLNINGVGAATARVILSSLAPAELQRVIATEDARALEKVKGIGAKTAQRILLELKGKLVGQADEENKKWASSHNTQQDDALLALTNLGIGKSMAQAALAKVKDADTLPIEELIKQALRLL